MTDSHFSGSSEGTLLLLPFAQGVVPKGTLLPLPVAPEEAEGATGAVVLRAEEGAGGGRGTSGDGVEAGASSVIRGRGRRIGREQAAGTVRKWRPCPWCPLLRLLRELLPCSGS